MKDMIIWSFIGAVVLVISIWAVCMAVKDFKEQLNAMKVLRVTALVVILSPIITYAILDLSRMLKKYQFVEAIGSADAWIGFAGSIIGGSITMIALYLTFRHERDVGRQHYIESIKPYISCRVANYDEDDRTIDVGKCIEDYGFIKCKMKNISNSIANISYGDQYISLEQEKGVYEKQENLDQFGISIYTVQLDSGFFLAPKDDYKWNVNFNIELDDDGNYKFQDSAFAFRYTILFQITDALKADTYTFEFAFDININIDTNGKPILFLDNQSNTILENVKPA
ncbi:MAG: hypothetical protein IJB02_02965 [Oscillospiraceae bacterium]|nr:hypothetical protein [Oscillospiraceae bacterium]